MSRLALGIAVCLLAAAIGCRDDHNIYTLDGPVPLTLFQVRDEAGQVHWSINSESPVEIADLRYGSVPRGFTQQIPPPGIAPRALEQGEKIVTVIVSTQAIYRHEGVASRDGRFRGGFGETAPLSAKTLQDALAGKQITKDR